MGQASSTVAAPSPANPPPTAAPPTAAPPDAAAVLGSSNSNPSTLSGNSIYDADVLERISQAANILKDDENATEIIRTVQTQQEALKAKHELDKAESVSRSKEIELQGQREKGDIDRSAMNRRQEIEQQNAQHQDQLARKRFQDEQQLYNQNQEQLRQQQLQSQRQLEEEKRQTLRYEHQLKEEMEMKKIKIDAEYRTRQERENRDIRDEQIVLQAREDRETTLEATRLGIETVGEGFREFLSDSRQVGGVIGGLTLLAAGIYGARSAAGVAGKYFESRMGKPPLVRKTTRRSALRWFTSPLESLRSLGGGASSDSAAIMDGIVLEDSLAARMKDITISASRRRQAGANFRHIMLHGPPGTGKTMFASRLAMQSGMDYAVLAGGDIGPLGNDASDELHRVFDWSESTSKGTLLFVDEADAFLRKRGSKGDGAMSENQRNALSTFLYRTGTPSNKFMMVLATNEPEAFDRAVTDRIDDVVEFGLPDDATRGVMLKHYYNALVVSEPGVEQMEDSPGKEFVDLTMGWSGRAVQKLVDGWQNAAYMAKDRTLTLDLMRSVVQEMSDEFDLKEEWKVVNLGGTSEDEDGFKEIRPKKLKGKNKSNRRRDPESSDSE